MAINKDDFAATLQKILLERIESGKLVLPVLPDVALKVERALQDPDVDLKVVASLLERDPVLCAQLIQSANSAAFRRGQKIESIRKAVPLLGVRNVKNLLLTTAARQVFSSRIPRVNDTLHVLWEHSLAVAVFSQDLAGLVELPEPDSAYLAGLLHDVGQAIVAIYLLEAERSLLDRRGINRQEWIDHDTWLDLVEAVHRPISNALAERWALPEPVIQAIRICDDYDMGNRRSICNVVRFSDALAAQIGIHANPPEEGMVNTYLMIGRSVLGVDEEVVTRLSNIGKRLVAENMPGAA